MPTPTSPWTKLRKIDTGVGTSTSTSTSTLRSPARSNTTSPVPVARGQGGRGGHGGEYPAVDSPDSLLSSGLADSPHPRRRDTSPAVTVIGMQPPPSSEVPFFGGAFSPAAASASGPPRPSLLSTRRTSGGHGHGHGHGHSWNGRRSTKWSRVLALAVVALAVWHLATRAASWSTRQAPRKKLVERWWEQEDQLSREDLSALLPRPTLPSQPPPRPRLPPLAPSARSHSLAQLLKLPSTLSAVTTSRGARVRSSYLAVVHLTSSSQLAASHLTPLVQSLAEQSPLAPESILLLVPAGLAPPASVLDALALALGTIKTRTPPRVKTLEYSPVSASTSGTRPPSPPLVVLANALFRDPDEPEFVLYVDGHSAGIGNRAYVETLLHALGTKPYSSSIVSAGGLSLSSSSSATATTRGGRDSCMFPGGHLDDEGGAGPVVQKVSIPSTAFLFATSYLFPRSYTNATRARGAGLEDEDEGAGTTTITATSPTMLQGVPHLSALPVEVALSWAAWTRSGIPTFALPLPLGRRDDGDGDGDDGGVCERLKKTLELPPRRDDDADEQGEGERTQARTTRWQEEIRRGFGNEMVAGEGLRRIRGDRTKGGGGTQAAARTASSPKERNALERAKEMRKGSLVLLLSGRDELDAVRKIACRFAAGGATRPDSGFDPLGLEGGGDRELRIVVADWNGDRADGAIRGGENDELCHLEVIPLVSATTAPGGDASRSADASISLPLIDMLDSQLDPAPAVVVYLADGQRAREFEEVLKWMGGIFGVRKGGERLSRVRMEKEAVAGGDEGNGRMTVIGIDRDEVARADWIGALPIEALRHWHTPRIDVSVITNDRPVSLHRLLLSLRSAHYFSDDVSLALNLEQTTDRLTHRLVDDFRWNHGPLTLRHRILLGGLMPAIVESWYPTSNDTYGVLLEDDVEVSPLFYGWLKFTILEYRYTAAGRARSSRLFGVSLYQQKNIELRPEGRQPFDAHRLFADLALAPTTPYLSQIPCSWGAAYFPEQWREFHAYLALRLSELALPVAEPIVPAIRSNRWPKSWKKYFIELVYLRGYTMLYPNFPRFESLSTNHLEKGTHVKTSQVEDKKKALFEVPLLDVDASLVDSLPGGGHLPEWDSLPVLDLWGAVASGDELVERGWQTTRMIGSCAALPDLGDVRLRYDARELLCKTRWGRQEGADARSVVTKSLPRRDRLARAPLEPTAQGGPDAANEARASGSEPESERARRV
ncbi:hypothetical protein JCM11491_003892 [Sporobolomyces phaffii]